MNKLLSILTASLLSCWLTVGFATDKHVYLSMINNSSFETKVVEGFVAKSSWVLEPGESKDSWFYFTSKINNLHFYYKLSHGDSWIMATHESSSLVSHADS